MDGLEHDLDGSANVVRIDLFSQVGRQTAGRYDVTMIPALLLFDGNGQLVGRQAGIIDAEAMRQMVVQLAPAAE